ncbi:MAG: hypothetical protein ACRC10_00430 [Thermoguttaceae bacterium]
MAGFNPFKKFRVYQKFLLAALGLMAIISFIILPALMMNSGGGSARTDMVIATCRNHGDITGSRLYSLRGNRELLRNFYTVLMQEMFPLVGENRDALTALFQMQMRYNGPILDEDVITEWVLARYSEEMGVVVGKELIEDYLNSLTGNMITSSVLSSVCTKLGLTETQLVPLLQEELLSANAVQMFVSSVRPLTPLARWDYFQRVRRSLTAEVAAVSTDMFLKEVPAPSDAQLKGFFEANKTVVYNPSLPESGFAVPTKIAFQVIDTMPSEELLASISEEEVKTFYEENKARYFMRQNLLQPEPSAQPGPFDQSLPGLDQNNSLLPTLPSQSSGNNPLFPSLGTPSLLNTSDEGNDKTGAEPVQEAEPVKAAEPVKESEPAVEKSGEGETRHVLNPVYRSVVFAQETAESTDEGTVEPAKEAVVEETVAVEPAKEVVVDETVAVEPAKEAVVEETVAVEPAKEAVVEETVAVEPAQEAVVEETVAVEPAQEAVVEETVAVELDSLFPPANAKILIQEEEEAFPLSPTENSLTDLLGSLDLSQVDTSVLFQPLEEVEPLIRQILAFRKVTDSVQAIEKSMRDYFTSYSLADFDNPSSLPKPIDLPALAAQHHLKCVVVEEPVSQFGAMTQDYYRDEFVRSFIGRIFGTRPANFDVLVGREGGSQQMPGFVTYIGWITERESQRTPEFSEPGVRDAVLKRWLEVESRNLAIQKARELANEANQSKGRSLKDVFLGKDLPIVETERFSWYTQSAANAGYARSQLLFGEVCEVGVPVGDADFENKFIKAPGNQFMQVAYSLEVNDCGAALNQPENTAYVIRLTESAPSEDLLWKFFSTTPLRDYEGAGVWATRQEDYRAWVSAVESRIGFMWILRPNTRAEMIQAE